MSAYCTKLLSRNLRSSIYRVSVSVRFIPYRAFSIKKSHSILSRTTKLAFLCWGAGRITYASAQEAMLPLRTTEKKYLSKLQVHRLMFVWRLGIHALVLLLKFSPLLLLYPLSLLYQHWTSCWLGALLWVTETSGPAFIKLGQWASTRRDIFSQEFCDRFSQLHIRVHAHSWTRTQQCLTRAFGEGWRQLVVFENKEPVGSGCVAQVYRANARVTSVKDPAFQQLVEGLEKEDLLEAWEIPGFRGTLGYLWWSEKGDRAMCENANRHCAELQHGDDKVLIPVAIKVQDNFVHKDLHPGNVLVHIDQGVKAQKKATLTDLWDTVVVSMRPSPPPLQLVLLDTGIAPQLSEGDLQNLRAVFTAVVLQQGERIAELILKHARANECQDVPRFKKEMAELVNLAVSDKLSLGKIQVAELLSQVFGLLIHHKVKLESNFSSIVFAIMVLEGLGRSLDPNLDLLKIAKSLLLKN